MDQIVGKRVPYLSTYGMWLFATHYSGTAVYNPLK